MTKRLKKSRYGVIAISLIVLFGAGFWGQSVLAKQLNKWQVLPQPQRFTELFFTDYRQLPTSYTIQKPRKLAFSVHNLEQRRTTYYYRITAASSDNSKSKQLGQGQFTLEANQTSVTNTVVKVPPLSLRTQVSVDLTYDGVAIGKSTLSLKSQSIDFWANFTNKLVGKGKT